MLCVADLVGLSSTGMPKACESQLPFNWESPAIYLFNKPQYYLDSQVLEFAAAMLSSFSPSVDPKRAAHQFPKVPGLSSRTSRLPFLSLICQR